MNYDEIMDNETRIDASQVEHLLRTHGHAWDKLDNGAYWSDDTDETIVTPDSLGEYPSAHVMHWLGY